MTSNGTRRLSCASATFVAACTAIACLPVSVCGGPILIDDFITPQSVTATAGSPTDFSSVAAAEAIGGERDMEVQLTDGFTNLTLSSNPFGGELLIHDSGATVTGMSKTVWDGVDGSAAIDYDGLGGVDLLTGQNAIQLDFVTADLTGDVTLTLYDASDATGSTWSSATLALPGGIFSPTVVLVPYTDFTTVGSSGAADFSNVGAIELGITNPTSGSLDVTIGKISAVPEPATLSMLVLGMLALSMHRRRF